MSKGTRGQFAFAIKSTGAVWTWGSNTSGQLGLNHTYDRGSPEAVVGSYSFDEIVGGSTWCLARDATTGLVYSWGAGGQGQLGNNSTASTSSPVAVAGGRSFIAIAAGFSSYGIEGSTGYIYAWGAGSFGALGDNTSTAKSSPVAVAGNRSYKAVAAGGLHAAALEASTGYAYGWGYNAMGQLGDNTKTTKSSPVLMAGNRSFDEVVCGGYFTLLRNAATGLAYTCGNNDSGQLGDNSLTGKSSPVAVAGNRSFSQIAAGDQHGMGLDATTGYVYSWGYNYEGELGNNSTTYTSSPVALAGNRSFIEISAHRWGGFGRTSDGLVYGWGGGSAGQIGDNGYANRSSPVAVAGNISFRTLWKLPLPPPPNTKCWGNVLVTA